MARNLSLQHLHSVYKRPDMTRRYSEYKFVSEPSKALKCLICLEVAKDPMQHEACGKLLCKECLENYGKDKPCPGCKRMSEYYIDNKSRRDIKALQVKCSNPNCAWEGTVGALEEHEVICRFALVPCPNECTDMNDHLRHIVRQDVGEHLRKDCSSRYTECQYCNMKGKYADMQIHDKACGRKVIPCPDIACSKSRPRDEMDEHITQDCLFSVIPCKFTNIGCSRRMRRKDMMVHEQNNDFHINMGLNTIIELKDTMTELKSTVVELKNTVVDLIDTVVKVQDVNTQRKEILQQDKRITPITFALTGYRMKKEMDHKFTSSPFYTSATGYRMAVRVFANGDGEGRDTHMSVCAPVMEGKYDHELRWPFIGSITFTLLNQLEDRNHYSHTTTLNAENKAMVGVDWGKPKFITHSRLVLDVEKKTLYLKDDTLYFKVSVEVANHKTWLECAPN